VSMHDEAERQRARSLGAAERMRGRIAAAPFAERIGAYNIRAARLAGQAAARSLAQQDRLQIESQLAALTSEVESSRREFESAAESSPGLSRLQDIGRALDRLAEKLGEIRAGLEGSQASLH
jgi:hypothetical protein